MPQLIKNNAAAADTWTQLSLGEGETPESIALPAGELIVPVRVWLARKNELAERPQLGLLFEPGDRVEDVAGDLQRFGVIAVLFPKFVDGRGYSTASLLRQRYGYTGELRAVGDVLHDQLFFMQRVGFDAFQLKDGKSLEYALAAGFTPFSEAYQGSTTQAQPAFRRHV